MKRSAFWAISNNVGDAYAAWLLRKISGELPAWGAPGDAAFMLSGSVLNHAVAGTISWGCGLASLKDEVHPQADIRAVRGPLTRYIALASGAKCPAVFGDAAMVAPRLYTPVDSKRHSRLGIVPHYVDQLRAASWFQQHEAAAELNGIKLINVFLGVEEFIEQIASCEYVLSSSLHGLVFAHAYGIPAGWIRIGDSIGGDGTKYRDHLLSVGAEPYEPLDLRSGWPEPKELFRFQPPQPATPFDDAALWEALPEEIRG
jgi:hypothetical protein